MTADLIIYAVSLALFVWAGWDDRSRPFDREHAVPIAQEGTTDGSQH